jgi:hypothetical protein
MTNCSNFLDSRGQRSNRPTVPGRKGRRVTNLPKVSLPLRADVPGRGGEVLLRESLLLLPTRGTGGRVRRAPVSPSRQPARGSPGGGTGPRTGDGFPVPRRLPVQRRQGRRLLRPGLPASEGRGDGLPRPFRGRWRGGFRGRSARIDPGRTVRKARSRRIRAFWGTSSASAQRRRRGKRQNIFRASFGEPEADALE